MEKVLLFFFTFGNRTLFFTFGDFMFSRLRTFLALSTKFSRARQPFLAFQYWHELARVGTEFIFSRSSHTFHVSRA